MDHKKSQSLCSLSNSSIDGSPSAGSWRTLLSMYWTRSCCNREFVVESSHSSSIASSNLSWTKSRKIVLIYCLRAESNPTSASCVSRLTVLARREWDGPGAEGLPKWTVGAWVAWTATVWTHRWDGSSEDVGAGEGCEVGASWIETPWELSFCEEDCWEEYGIIDGLVDLNRTRRDRSGEVEEDIGSVVPRSKSWG